MDEVLIVEGADVVFVIHVFIFFVEQLCSVVEKLHGRAPLSEDHSIIERIEHVLVLLVLVYFQLH